MTLIAIVLEASAQVASPSTLHLPIDLANVAAWAAKGVLALVSAGLLWVVKEAVQSFVSSFNAFKTEMSERLDTLDTSISQVQSDVQTTKQELFGATGGNGIRGELREIKADARKTKEIVQSHDVTLARLADKAGVPFES